MSSFIEDLKNGDFEGLQKHPKSDLHNHAPYSCTVEYLIANGIDIPDTTSIVDFPSFLNYIRTYIDPLKYDKDKFKILLNGNFINCINSGVKTVSVGIDYKKCIRAFNSDINDFVNFLKQFNYDNLKINWILEISRDSYKEEHRELIKELLSTNYFAGIDLVSTENSVPNSMFKEFYEIANKMDLVTKVHAGEQLGSDYMKECIIDFNPKQIQHGITIVDDKEVIKMAIEKGIVFNICPTSNVVLGYVECIKNHPIKQMVENNLNVTIATDDLLLFNSNINEEYYKLYSNGVLTAEQLDKIRLYGLSAGV